MKHKLFTLLIAVMASLGSMFAQSGTCGDNLTWNLTDGVLTISGTGAMADYTSSSKAPWFAYSNSINSVVIGDGVTSIGNYAFSSCSSLASLTIPNSVISIGNRAFMNCVDLTSIEIPNSVTNIGEYAFWACSGLTYITIPNSVTSIGDYAFEYCTGLTSVTIPNSVTSIGNYAFRNCTGLTSINVSNGNANYCSVEGVLFNKDNTVLVQYPGGKKGNYTIPNSVTSIGDYAFYYCSGLTSVTIGNSVINIGKYAFNLCRGLTSVAIGNSVTNIGKLAFSECTGLTSIEIPNGVTTIGNQAFNGCRGLTSVTIGNSVTIIDQAFRYCTSLTTVTNYATTPQAINANVFDNVNKSSCTLYVPAQSLAAYQAADVWKEFGNILAIDDSTEEVNYATLADIYNMAADSTFTLGAFDVMYVPDFQSGSNMYIKDSTGSCVIYKVNYGLQAGDHVEAGLQGKVHIYNGLYEITPISTKEELTVTSGEAPAPMVATEAPSLNNASQYVVYEGVSFTTDTAFVEGRRHTVYGSWNGQTITFYNQYYIGATLSANKTYNITAVNTIYRTTPQAYPLAVEEIISDTPEPCIIASGTCGAQGDNLTWTLSCDSVLTISGTGAMDDYYSYESIPWYEYIYTANSIKSVIIQEGVTHIGQYAFRNCHLLASVSLANSLTSIGGGAFSYCGKLPYVKIPSSVTNLGIGVFEGCPSMSAFEVSEANPNFCSVDGVLFDKNISTLMQYPPSKTNTTYSIPSNVVTIAETAFWCSRNLTIVTIPNGVASIGSSAFLGCSGLTSVTIPNSVATIGQMPFVSCTNLPSIDVDPGNPYFCSIDGVLFNKDKTNLIEYPIGKAGTSYVIPDGVIVLGNGAFEDCTSLISVTIPSSVESIGDFCFAYCRNLRSVTNYATLPQNIIGAGLSADTLYVPAQSVEAYKAADVWKEFTNILSIGESSDSCVIASGTCGAEGDNLTWTLTCDSVLTISGTGAMADYDWYAGTPWYSVSESIKSIKIEDGVTSIGSSAFSNCFSLTTITIPNSVTSIGNNTFDGCTNMTSVEIGNNVSSIGTLAFRDCRSLTSITIPNSVTYIGYWTFNGCTGLTTIEIPNSVTNIGDGPFSECTNLSSIIAAVDNTKYCTIDGVLFSNDKTKIVQYPGAKQGAYTIPHSVTRIGGGAFYGCAGLTSVDVHNSITSIGNSAFRNCSGLISIEIPNSVTNIGNAAFENCTGLTSITIPNSVTYIEVSAFENCTGLTSITIHNAVTILSQWAFSRCTGLTSFKNYATTPQTINADVFRTVNLSACTLYVPAESLAAYQAADVWKEFGNILAIDDSTEEVNYATLADIYNMAADSTFTLGAFDVMYVPDFQSGSNMYIKDSTGSCVIYKVNYGLQAGDHVEAGLQGKVSIYNGLHEVNPITAKEDLIITHGEAPAPIVATEAPSLNNASQYVVYEGVSFTTDTAFVEGRRHTVYGSWNGQTITFYNQYYIGATLSANKTYNITAVNTIYRTTPQAYPLVVEEVSPAPCIVASGTCGAEGDNLTWTLSCDSVLTISGTGAMADYNNADNMPAPWFQYHTFIQSVIIEDGITSIGFEAFWECDNLQSVDIPNSVVNIEAGAFCNCYNLESVTIPSSVTNIGTFAFYNCHRLTSITIPSSVATLGRSPFGSCINVPSIEVANDNPNYCSVDGVLFNKQQTILIQYPAGKANSTYTIPSSVTDIQYCAFSSCSWLNTITIGNHVTNIDAQAFYGCSELTSMVIPNSITKIGDHTFYNCTSLISVTIPSSVMSIGEGAFAYCRSLTSVTNYATEPQVIVPITFYYVNLSSCTLYVPAESVEAYKAADVWKEFTNILPIEGTEEPIETIEGNYTIYYVGKDSQDLTDEIVTLHVPVAPVIEGFTFLKWVIVAGDLEDGIAIQAVYEADMQTGTPEVYTNPANHAQKLLRNGHVYILTDDRTYTIQGQRTK